MWSILVLFGSAGFHKIYANWHNDFQSLSNSILSSQFSQINQFLPLYVKQAILSF